MKLMIASDIHGSAYYCRKMLEAYDREKADKLLLLGDILYHGPRNDLPKEYAPKEVIAMLNARKQEILCVRGNCDTEVDQMVLEFPILADYCFLNLNGQNIYATHGHVWNPGKLPMLKAGDILLNGHTHIPACEKIHTEADQSVMYMNPGSVSIPKENSEHSYMICENGVFEWKNLEGEGYQIWKRTMFQQNISNRYWMSYPSMGMSRTRGFTGTGPAPTIPAGKRCFCRTQSHRSSSSAILMGKMRPIRQ